MAQAKCMRCGAAATGDSFEDASEKINHAVGMSRGVPCGKNYDRVVEIKDDKPKTKPLRTKIEPQPKTETTPAKVETIPSDDDSTKEKKPKKSKDKKE